MLVVPTIGGRLAYPRGWRRLFATALTLISAGRCALVTATLTGLQAAAERWAFAGMVLIGTGAALSHPQLSGAVVALAPQARGGVASAVTVIARQAGFAVGVAILGVLAPVGVEAPGFA